MYGPLISHFCFEYYWTTIFRVQTFSIDFHVSYYIWHAYMISISVFSIFMCQCIYLMSLLLYMLKIMKKMNIFCLFKYLSRFADFFRRCCREDIFWTLADVDVFFYASRSTISSSSYLSIYSYLAPSEDYLQDHPCNWGNLAGKPQSIRWVSESQFFLSILASTSSTGSLYCLEWL